MKKYNVKIYGDISNPKNMKLELDRNFEINDVVALPTFKYLNLDKKSDYNIFDLNNATFDNLVNQFKNFNTKKLTFLYIDDIIKFENNLDDIIKFAKLYNIKIVAKVGSTLDEMGLCDKIFGLTPVGVLEQYGVLDLEPIILSGTNLDKDDFEKLKFYNASLCLNITSDMLNGFGIAQIVTAKKYNLNMFFNCIDIYKEMFLAFALPRGILNNVDAISVEDVISMACFNMDKAFNTKSINTFNVFNTNNLHDIVLSSEVEVIDNLKI